MKIQKNLTVGILVVGAALVSAAYYFQSWQKRILLLPPKEVWSAVQQFKFQGLPAFSERDLQLAQLGRAIFHDPRFSANGQVSCATCHQPGKSFTDGLAKAKGISFVDRNSPTLINSFAGRWFFWDGRADSLEAQATGPLESAKEHGISRARLAVLIAQNYLSQYEVLFGKIPKRVLGKIPLMATPHMPPLYLSEKMAGYALATLTDETHYQRLVLEPHASGMTSADRFNEYLQKDKESEGEKNSHFNYSRLDLETKKTIDEILLNVSISLASFERGLWAIDAPFDRFLKSWKSADELEKALSQEFDLQAYQGLNIFLSKGRCFLCHSGPTLSDGEFHNIGLAADGDLALGRSLGVLSVKVNPLNCESSLWDRSAGHRESESCKELPFLDTENLEILGAFKTPTLRNLSSTAPYMHAGQLKTLEDVIEHYDQLKALPAIGHREETLKPLGLNDAEKKALLAFLRSLNSDVKDMTAP